MVESVDNCASVDQGRMVALGRTVLSKRERLNLVSAGYRYHRAKGQLPLLVRVP